MTKTRRQSKNTHLLFKSWELVEDYEVGKAMRTLDRISPPVDRRTRLKHILHGPGVFNAGYESREDELPFDI